MTGTAGSLDLDQLIRQQDFVRRLARSLVFEQEHIDDIVQETWLAALRNPPREPAAVRTWFGRVIENLARRRGRDEVRRARRERAAAASEALPSVTEVLAREEQRKQIVAAVVALPEPYRGVVLARYFEGLEPSEIARRKEIPAATVRSQLKRGLEMLRKRLDTTHGDRKTWCLLLVPIAHPESASGLLAPSPLPAVALLLTKLISVAGGLALAVLGILWFTNSNSAAPPASQTSALDAVRDAPALAGAARADSAPMTRSELLDPGEAAGSTVLAARVPAGYRGRLLRQDGNPAPDELVRFVGVDAFAVIAEAGTDGKRNLSFVRSETRTAGDGTFTVSDLKEHGSYAMTLAADGKDKTTLLLQVSPGPEEIVDLGDLKLVAKAALTGRVVDTNGEPIADAEVLCLDLPALLRAVLPFDRFAPEHGGFLSLPVPNEAELGNSANYATRLRSYLGSDLFMDTDLDRRPSLAIYPVDRMPWLETLWNELPIARARSGSDGRFQVLGAQPGANWVIVRKPGFAPGGHARLVLRANEARELGDQRLDKGEAVSGRVRDAGGRPVSRAEIRVGMVSALGYRGVAFAEAPVLTDAHGRFTVSGLSNGRVLVAARANPSDPWHVAGPVDVGSDLEIALPVASTLVVRVVDPSGLALPAARIQAFVGPWLGELRRAGVQQELPLDSRLERADGGAVRICGVPPGCYTLVVGAPGYTTKEVVVRTPATAPVLVELPSCTPLNLSVSDADAKPVFGAKVYLQREGQDDRAVMPTDYGLPRWKILPHYAGVSAADGRLTCPNRPAGRVFVHVVHPMHGIASVACEASESELRVRLERPGEIVGRVLDHGKAADARRHALKLEPIGASGSRQTPFAPSKIALRGDGTFEIRGVPPGRYEVRVVERREEPLSLSSFVEVVKSAVYVDFIGAPDQLPTRELEVLPGGVARLELDLDPNAPLVGQSAARLFGSLTVGGVPAPGATLSRMNRNNLYAWIPLAEVGPDGSFVANQVPPGRQTLRWCSAGNEELWQGEVDLEPGSQRRLDVRLEITNVRGTAGFTTNLPVAGYVATASGTIPGGIVTRTTMVAADGSFRFAGLPLGTYAFHVAGQDGTSTPLTFVVTAGTEVLPEKLTLEEFLVFRGTLVGIPDGVSTAMLVIRHDNVSRGTQVGADGRFAFGPLQPGVYSLELVGLRSKTRTSIEPDRVDLTRGSLRDLQLRVRQD